MSIVVADLVARVRSEGVSEANAQIKSVGDSAAQTTKALELMAEQLAKKIGGTSGEALDMLKRTGAQPTAAAMAEAARAMEQTAAAATKVVAPTQAAAKAAADHAASTGAAAKSAQELGRGFDLSTGTLLRAAGALTGVGLGLSAAVGIASQLHDVIAGIVTSQLDWERSLKNLSGLYGEAGGRAAAFATAQSNLPGVLGQQQEFASAAINASGLTLRYGLPQRLVDQLTTTGGRIAFSTGMTDQAERSQLQAQLLAAVQTGAPLPARYGIYTDAEAVARNLGLQGAASLQTFTPQELIQARGAVVAGQGNAFADRTNANPRAALDIAVAAEKALEQARNNIQNNLEGRAVGGIQGPTVAERTLTRSILEYGQPAPAPVGAGTFVPAVQASADIQGLSAIDAERQVMQASDRYAKALADSTKAQEEAAQTLDQLAHSADAAGARLISFFGSLEDTTSIAHGDILAQSQGAVTARARSAVPVQGMSGAEISAIATGTAFQQAWQNYVAPLAQQESTNAIQRFLTDEANRQGPGLEGRRTAAQGALEQAPQLAAINSQIGQATTRGAQVDIQAADTQASLERIALTQRERYVQLLRDTVDLRRLDVQQQQAGIQATQQVIRATQAGLPAQYALSDAQSQTSHAAVLAQARLARTLQGKDVSGLPSIEDLVQMNVRGQLATAEAGPAAFDASRAVELAQRPSTAAGLAQALTGGQLQNAQLSTDLKNLGDLPEQTALQLELVQNNRDQLSVQTELREYMKQLVSLMTDRPPGLVPSDQADRVVATASPALAGARR